MRNFLCIASDVPVQPLLVSLARHPELWNQYDLRTAWPEGPHALADDILLRFQPHDWACPDPRECVNYPAFAQLAECRQLVMALASQVGCERLGRCVITRLKPGDGVPPHADIGTHPLHYDPIRYWARFHIVLATDPCALFRCEDEVVHMRAGEVWYFRNDLEHEVFWQPGGQTDRVHLIVDMHTAAEPVR